MKLTTHVELDIEDFAESLSVHEAFRAIKAIDSAQQDLEFTHECAKFFLREVIDYSEDYSGGSDAWLKDIREMLK